LPAKDKSAVTIGSLTAEPGQMVHSFLDVGETATGPVQLPLVIINGVHDGPTLCFTAGVHATEYASIAAVMRLINGVLPNELHGCIIAVPVVSMHMFAARLPFVSPLDGVNLNKIAPGGDESISAILLRALFDEVIAKARYHIDFHAGDFGEMLLAFAGYSLTGDEKLDREGEALARIFTPQVFCIAPQGTGLPPSLGFVAHAAAQKGIVSILAEAGGNGTLEEDDVSVHVNGARNVMRYLRMIEGGPEISGPQILATDWHNTRVTRSGLLYLKVAVGDRVSEGQEVAEVYDIFGRSVEKVRARKAGLAMLVWNYKAVNTGDPVVRCWSISPAPPFPETDRFLSQR
jgi:predicted deacylase